VITPVTLPRTARHRMHGADGDYDVLVGWPAEPPPASGYPVIYLLDANATFGMFVEAIRMRAHRPESTGVAPAIVVGVAYPTDEPYERARRARDYTPDASTTAESGAERFLDGLIDTIRPAAEAGHAIDPARRVIVGHSLGGLLVLHTLLTRPSAFVAYVAISPSIWWNPPALYAAIEAGVARMPADAPRRKVMLTVGEFEQPLAPWQHGIASDEVRRRRHARGMVDHVVRFADALRAASDRLEVSSAVFDGEDHASVVTRSLSPALRFVLAPAR
jgi:predicted alpha/beta superfamily hydrolase